MEKITSAANPAVKRLKALSDAKGRKEHGAFLVEGEVMVREALASGLSPLEAVRKLDADLGLGLPLDRPLSPEERERAREEARQRQARRDFREWRERQLNTLCAAIRAGNDALKKPMEEWNAREELAVRVQARLEWYADLLESEDRKEQEEVYGIREEVQELCT